MPTKKEMIDAIMEWVDELADMARTIEGIDTQSGSTYWAEQEFQKIRTHIILQLNEIIE
jgi:hypothetical protein